VFKFNPDGAVYTVLKHFALADGVRPSGSLVQGSDGALYGTAYEDGNDPNIFGIVFKLNPDGTGYTVLHTFAGPPADGDEPVGGMLVGMGGTLYGTTAQGGSGDRGTVFKLNRDGAGYTVLYKDFGNAIANGFHPQAGLVQGSDGALFGTAEEGGITNVPFMSQGLGTMFKLNPDGSGFTVLHSFGSITGDGVSPAESPLTIGMDGAFYGVTENGGADDLGTVFKVNPDGSGYAVLHSFDYGGSAEGLVQGSDGTLFGTTEFGGTNIFEDGTVFKLKPDGSGFTVLHDFSTMYNDDGPDGIRPEAVLLIGSDGAMYGTTVLGGPFGSGILFRLRADAVCTFDPPTAAGACCGPFAAITVLGTVTNMATCAQMISRTYRVMDCCGNASLCTQTVTVVSAPALTCPSNIVVKTCDTNVVVTWPNPTVASPCSSVTVTSMPASGTVFLPNTTNTVICTASDACGNSNSCTFMVTVLRPVLGAPTISLVGSTITIAWTDGILQQADSVPGPWTDVQGAAAPYHTDVSAAQKFYRLRCASP
jgi:uncharacterized repeat protein (TIGR03803 family)